MRRRNVAKRLHGFLRVHVDHVHEPARVVGANRHHHEVKGAAAGADVAESSGHDELDQAAVKCVNGAWTFKPAEENGRPVPSTKQYRIVWKLAG